MPARAARTLVVPDERSWSLWGRDPRAHGLAPGFPPEQAEAILLPDPLPEALAAAAAASWRRLPEPRRLVVWEAPLPGRPLAAGFEHAAAQAPAADEHDHHHEHPHPHDADAHGGHADADGAHGGEAAHGEGGTGTHDHHAMMAITGEPSSDGLVMEPIELELGPIAAGLPGGLVLALSLDGDVVASCRPRALLGVPQDAVAAGMPPDPLAPAAWGAALALARGGALEPARVAAVERERALSHATSLRGLGEVLGWAELAERAHAAVLALVPGQPDEAAAARALDRLLRLVEGSRRLRSRARGRAVLAAARLAPTEVAGPVARAAGLDRDARSGDPFYAALGFRAELHDAGDAEARTLVRAREALASARLAAAALAQDGATRAVEGPRGPLRASVHGPHVAVSAPGEEELRSLAGEAVVGLELAAALAAIASFDLSPWRVPA